MQSEAHVTASPALQKCKESFQSLAQKARPPTTSLPSRALRRGNLCSAGTWRSLSPTAAATTTPLRGSQRGVLLQNSPMETEDMHILNFKCVSLRQGWAWYLDEAPATHGLDETPPESRVPAPPLLRFPFSLGLSFCSESLRALQPLTLFSQRSDGRPLQLPEPCWKQTSELRNITHPQSREYYSWDRLFRNSQR